jgi:hypothetical protein
MQPEVKWLMNYLDDHEIIQELENAVALAYEWSYATHSYASKNIRIAEWNPEMSDLYDIICKIFAGCIINPNGMTYQAMIGYIVNDIECVDPLDRAKCAAELIALAYQAELIVITKVSDTVMMITTEFELNEDMPDFSKHMVSFKKPLLTITNPILGNRFKQHDHDVCTAHIDKMNAIPLVLEHRVIGNLSELSTVEDETDEQLIAWNDFQRRSMETYIAVGFKEFYMNHAYDTRGRIYSQGYYINPQGSSYKKAIVQLADKEIIHATL